MDVFREGLGTNVPPHVVNRVSALVGGASILVAIGAISQDEQQNRVGSFAAFTDRLVVQVTMSGSGWIEDFRQDNSPPTVEASVWRRDTLTSLSIGSSQGNTDYDWNYTEGGWASRFSAKLNYAGGETVHLIVPSDVYPSQSQRIETLLTALQTDLLA